MIKGEKRELKHKNILPIILVLLLAMILIVPRAFPQPKVDVLRYLVIKSPDAQTMAMKLGMIDVLTGLTRPVDVHELEDYGCTITYTSGFHIFFTGFNVRADQSYRRPEITFWPLADVNFRHALAHSLNRDAIQEMIFDWWLTNNATSMVPPSLDEWHNPDVDPHPFNLGDPFTSPPGEDSTVGILLTAGYTFVDADSSGTVTNADYWNMPNDDPLPDLYMLSPTYEVDPVSFTIVSWWIEVAGEIGLAGTLFNGWSGLIHIGFADYINQVYGAQDFDAFVISFDLDRFPDYLYDWFHSSQDFPGAGNAFGVQDPELDVLLDTIKFSIDHTAKVEACKAAQERLADSDQPWGLPTIPIYSINYFDAFNPGLSGIVLSRGYGGDNIWTYLNIHWTDGVGPHGDNSVIWCLKDEPYIFNPLSGDVYAWKLMDSVFDPLIAVNPYNRVAQLRDIPWIAIGWEAVETATGMDVTYYLRDDVFWQDGYQYTAYDAEFSLEFIRDWEIPRYTPAWENIVDVEVINDYTFTVHADETSQFLIYDWATLGALLPPQVWDRPWSSLDEILNYDLTESYNPAPGYPPGLTPPPTNLFGTGPFIFQLYNWELLYGDLWANQNYFMTIPEVDYLKTEMLHEIGDVNRDGHIWAYDMAAIGLAYNSSLGEPGYNPDADLNEDGVIDIYDILANGGGFVAHFGMYRTYGGSGGSSSQSTEESRNFPSQSFTIRESQETTEPVFMYADPPEILDCSLGIDDLFSVDIKIANVADLMGYDFKVTFNSTILSVVSVTPGDFFGADPEIWHNNTNNAKGFVRFAMTPKAGTQKGATGFGKLATIRFRVKVCGGNCSIKQKGFTKLANSHGINVTHTTLDGYFDNRLFGDLNCDKLVDIEDLVTVGLAWASWPGHERWNPVADIVKDNFIGIEDLSAVGRNYGKGCGS